MAEKWEPKKEAESMERVLDKVKAEIERQSNEWVGDGQGMVE